MSVSVVCTGLVGDITDLFFLQTTGVSNPEEKIILGYRYKDVRRPPVDRPRRHLGHSSSSRGVNFGVNVTQSEWGRSPRPGGNYRSCLRPGSGSGRRVRTPGDGGVGGRGSGLTFREDLLQDNQSSEATVEGTNSNST